MNKKLLVIAGCALAACGGASGGRTTTCTNYSGVFIQVGGGLVHTSAKCTTVTKDGKKLKGTKVGSAVDNQWTVDIAGATLSEEVALSELLKHTAILAQIDAEKARLMDKRLRSVVASAAHAGGVAAAANQHEFGVDWGRDAVHVGNNCAALAVTVSVVNAGTAVAVNNDHIEDAVIAARNAFWGFGNLVSSLGGKVLRVAPLAPVAGATEYSNANDLIAAAGGGGGNVTIGADVYVQFGSAAPVKVLDGADILFSTAGGGAVGAGALADANGLVRRQRFNGIVKNLLSALDLTRDAYMAAYVKPALARLNIDPENYSDKTKETSEKTMSSTINLKPVADQIVLHDKLKKLLDKWKTGRVSGAVDVGAYTAAVATAAGMDADVYTALSKVGAEFFDRAPAGGAGAVQNAAIAAINAGAVGAPPEEAIRSVLYDLKTQLTQLHPDIKLFVDNAGVRTEYDNANKVAISIVNHVALINTKITATIPGIEGEVTLLPTGHILGSDIASGGVAAGNADVTNDRVNAVVGAVCTVLGNAISAVGNMATDPKFTAELKAIHRDSSNVETAPKVITKKDDNAAICAELQAQTTSTSGHKNHMYGTIAGGFQYSNRIFAAVEIGGTVYHMDIPIRTDEDNLANTTHALPNGGSLVYGTQVPGGFGKQTLRAKYSFDGMARFGVSVFDGVLNFYGMVGGQRISYEHTYSAPNAGSASIGSVTYVPGTVTVDNMCSTGVSEEGASGVAAGEQKHKIDKIRAIFGVGTQINITRNFGLDVRFQMSPKIKFDVPTDAYNASLLHDLCSQGAINQIELTTFEMKIGAVLRL
ncbi:MAG: hypothetical protein LBG13_01710 [Holosporales bacterium]|nr:hypothetical protein [Holosporales bacterium]